jgi:hypothetical protein
MSDRRGSGSVRDQLHGLEARKRDILTGLRAQQSQVEVEIHPNIPELYRRKVGKLQALLEDETTRPQAMDIVRSLVEHVEIHPAEERYRCGAILTVDWLRFSPSPTIKRPASGRATAVRS